MSITTTKKTSVTPTGLQAQIIKDSKMVKGIFRNFETPGGVLKFSAKSFPREKLTKYTLVDGEECELPAGVARRLARECYVPTYGFTMDKDGKPLQQVGKKVYRFGFQSLEFMGDDSIERSLIDEPIMQPLSL